ncbi:MAG: hypothetical protein AVDCRST_MAG70-1956 [uncultured Thermomicrobiales bacterium]|uniref:Uncharacterized protein n=1 Tax=uncultured Thermomicrobiales bacterium TaxID=1645740 RepID=A0A6J4V0D3_9BACT|nr:MAG: hypothetical protein AVDCRST_MAG70-1956 [uncultured Thermomicrobiales bacterium]
MAVTAPPRPPATRPPGPPPTVPPRPRTDRDDSPRRPDEPDHAAAWAFIWILFAFKMITVFLIWWASRSYETGVFLAATTWFWIVVPMLALAAPIAFRWRLIRVRRRRAQLQRSEWLVDLR